MPAPRQGSHTTSGALGPLSIPSSGKQPENCQYFFTYLLCGSRHCAKGFIFISHLILRTRLRGRWFYYPKANFIIKVTQLLMNQGLKPRSCWALSGFCPPTPPHPLGSCFELDSPSRAMQLCPHFPSVKPGGHWQELVCCLPPTAHKP